MKQQQQVTLAQTHMSKFDSSTFTTESTMDTTTTTATTTTPRFVVDKEGDKSADKEGDTEVWKTFNRSFDQVQSVLDRNRVLINQVNENHRSKIPDNMVKNVALIQEINSNISKVVSLYSDLSANFSGMFHKRNKNDDDDDGKREEDMEKL